MSSNPENPKFNNSELSNIELEKQEDKINFLKTAKAILKRFKDMNLSSKQQEKYLNYLNTAVENLIIYSHEYYKLGLKDSLNDIITIEKNLQAFNNNLLKNKNDGIHIEAEKIINEYSNVYKNNQFDKQMVKKVGDYYDTDKKKFKRNIDHLIKMKEPKVLINRNANNINLKNTSGNSESKVPLSKFFKPFLLKRSTEFSKRISDNNVNCEFRIMNNASMQERDEVKLRNNSNQVFPTAIIMIIPFVLLIILLKKFNKF